MVDASRGERKVTFFGHATQDEAWEALATWQMPQGYEVTYAELFLEGDGTWTHSISYAPAEVAADIRKPG